MIKFTNLNKFFNKGKKNEIHVVNNATLELPDTGIVTFFGHSGSGKTTLLNVLGGLDSFKGEIQYDDTTLKNYKMGQIDKWRRANVGYVFQNYDLLQNESVYDNLEIALSIIGINDKEEAKARIEYALKAVGLYKYRKKKAFALSGGQMQRVAIARALIKKCKVLLADEPTGNLDSANTIEVMNVLKSISKNTLVLLVTHEKNIADFYSDQIIEMADGEITSVKINESQEALIQEEHSNAVYLGDMDKVEQDGDTLSLTIYKDPGDESKKHIDVFIKKNTLYIRGDSTIRVANENTLKIIDGKRKTIKKKDEQVESYDNSFFDDSKKGKRGFRSFLIGFLSSWQSIFSAKKKTKLLYASLTFMGVVFSIASISYVNNTTTDDSSFVNAKGYYTVQNLTFSDSDKILQAYDEGYIKDAIYKDTKYFSYKESWTFVESVSASFNAAVLPYNKDFVTLAYGRETSSKGEIILSMNKADEILSNFTIGYDVEHLVGKTLENPSNSDETYKIVGISSGDNNVVYVCDADYILGLNEINYSGDGVKVLNASIEKGHYKVVGSKSRDVNLEAGSLECLINLSMAEKVNNLYYLDGDTISLPADGLVLDGTEKFGDYNIVGYFEPTESIKGFENAIITNKNVSFFKHRIDDVVPNGFYSPLFSYIVEGKEPVKSNEIAVDAYSQLQIGDVFNGFNVVGRVSGGVYVDANRTMFNVNVRNVRMSTYSSVFTTKDLEASKTYFKEEHEMNFDTIYNIAYKEQLASEDATKAIFYTVFAITFSIASVFIFFIMRSRMLADIYTIGVYRSLGAKRWSIISKYLVESAILTFMFTIVGYAVGCFIYTFFSVLINAAFDALGVTIAMTNIPAFILIGCIIFVVSTLVGALPIVALFRKTPAQIKSKYDI